MDKNASSNALERRRTNEARRRAASASSIPRVPVQVLSAVEVGSPLRRPWPFSFDVIFFLLLAPSQGGAASAPPAPAPPPSGGSMHDGSTPVSPHCVPSPPFCPFHTRPDSAPGVNLSLLGPSTAAKIRRAQIRSLSGNTSRVGPPLGASCEGGPAPSQIHGDSPLATGATSPRVSGAFPPCRARLPDSVLDAKEDLSPLRVQRSAPSHPPTSHYCSPCFWCLMELPLVSTHCTH